MSAVAAALNASMAKERKKSEKRKRKEKEKEKESGAAQAKETETAPLAAADLDFGAFDYDALKADPDAELWLVRVPSGIKPKHLEHLRIDAPSSSRTGRVGSLARKDRTYDVWARDPADVDAAVGGDELGGLSVLLPRAKKDGTLHLAPKAVARHLVLALPPARPEAEAPLQTYQNPPRHAYPEEILTHRFRPFGARENIDEGGAEAMDVDAYTASPARVKDKAEAKEAKEKEKGRKRKVEESPTKVKKAKKAKTDA